MACAFPAQRQETTFYDDVRLYACLADQPLVPGHSIVAWKTCVPDLHSLTREEYEHLMSCVERVRSALMETLRTDKVYLLYMDEVQHVHWHLIPRHSDKGLSLLCHEPSGTPDLALLPKLKESFNPSR